jgi:uncharacterized repeat protein (TIGR03803 family)
VRKLSPAKIACALFAFCVATAIALPAQSFTTLVNFDGTNGADPGFMSLVQGVDGNLYGTAYGGGASSYGTVFKITPGGTLTTLYSFCSQLFCADGSHPGALVQATNGDFYGTTVNGGADSSCGLGGFLGCGTVFKITPAGMLTTLHSFDGADGRYPEGELVQATNGDLYGTTSQGGANDDGTVFKINPAGKTTLYNFCSITNSAGDCLDGDDPMFGLVQATNGDFYGTTSNGGAKRQRHGL